jgi:hypothetical protein
VRVPRPAPRARAGNPAHPTGWMWNSPECSRLSDSRDPEFPGPQCWAGQANLSIQTYQGAGQQVSRSPGWRDIMGVQVSPS